MKVSFIISFVFTTFFFLKQASGLDFNITPTGSGGGECGKELLSPDFSDVEINEVAEYEITKTEVEYQTYYIYAKTSIDISNLIQRTLAIQKGPVIKQATAEEVAYLHGSALASEIEPKYDDAGRTYFATFRANINHPTVEGTKVVMDANGVYHEAKELRVKKVRGTAFTKKMMKSGPIWSMATGELTQAACRFVGLEDTATAIDVVNTGISVADYAKDFGTICKSLASGGRQCFKGIVVKASWVIEAGLTLDDTPYNLAYNILMSENGQLILERRDLTNEVTAITLGEDIKTVSLRTDLFQDQLQARVDNNDSIIWKLIRWKQEWLGEAPQF